MTGADQRTEALLPEIVDADIREAEQLLCVDFDESRCAILRSNASFDVQACPGSGKTTLLVAKLAIMASKWPHARRGICVLSHTNVARQEIERKLAGTTAGQRLLNYPHFVGTIHRFVNEFLALPLLRSEMREISRVDDDACFHWMKRHLMSWPTSKRLGNLPYRGNTFDRNIRSLVCCGVPETLQPPKNCNSDQWSAFVETKSKAMDKGIYYHADMFAVAERLLSECPVVAGFARFRFPAVFIDEMQDTSELQNRVLAAVFPTSSCGLRQRFGDSNQAIYDLSQAEAITDSFPGNDMLEIPDSQRFGSDIATKAAPLAPTPPEPTLVGVGPRRNLFPVHVDSSGLPHTIFLFAAGSVEQVLASFGSLLLESFPDNVLHSDAFVARAIGRVGKPGEDDSKCPRHLGDYWEGYEPRAARLDPRPERLADYVHLAQRGRSALADCAYAVKTVEKGLVELIEILGPDEAPPSRQGVRWLSEAIKDDQEALGFLRRLMWGWCIEIAPPGESEWVGQVESLKRVLRPITGNDWPEGAKTFCQWSAEFMGEPVLDAPTRRTGPNLYHFVDGERFVEIDVGTIHSAKGQTHTATLVLETFYKRHDLADLLKWVLGSKSGAERKEGPERLARMRLVYTAMTRPTHLLCLAMRQEALGDGQELKTRIGQFQSMGWKVQVVK